MSPPEQLIRMSVWSLPNCGSISYHHKAEVQAYAATHNIKFYWTPTNASWLNRIECHFTALKKFALDNTDYRSHAEQEAAIEQHLVRRNRKRQISIQDWHMYRTHRQRKPHVQSQKSITGNGTRRVDLLLNRIDAGSKGFYLRGLLEAVEISGEILRSRSQSLRRGSLLSRRQEIRSSALLRKSECFCPAKRDFSGRKP
ncbi:MAG: transposase [Phycisphaerae bacterium]|nr:transposase [Phycisphaerae bacterium]